MVAIIFVGAVLTAIYLFKPQEPLENTPQDINLVILVDIKEAGIDCGDNGCRVDKVVGDYAKGVMPLSYWIAQKTNNKWQVVVTGNGIPNCTEVDKYQIPLEIYGNCILKSGELRN